MTPSDFDALKRTIATAEGFRADPYPDANGFSVGYGFWSSSKPPPTTQTQADAELARRLAQILIELSKGTVFRQLSSPRQSVLIEMAYNLGIGGLAYFKSMWTALSFDRYDEAANEIINSKASHQLPSRYARLAKQMRTNQLQKAT